MITEIQLNNVTSYKKEVIVKDLKRVNFFFGNNGSGKSTLAKFLYNLGLDNNSIEKSNDFNSCSQIGYNSNSHQIIVFDEKFIERNFILKDNLSGIFSLNQGNEQINKLIDEEQLIVKKYEDYLKNTLTKRKANLITKRNDDYRNIKDKCFEERKSTINSFLKIKDTFPNRQTQNNYDTICKTLIDISSTNPVTLETLLSNYKSYYDDDIIRLDNILPKKLYREIRTVENELQLLLQEIIVGNDDVDIAKMINDLGISEWVNIGRTYLKSKELQSCPFCQKITIDSELILKFEKYFNDNYKNKTKKIVDLKTTYQDLVLSYLTKVKTLSEIYNKNNVVTNLYQDLSQAYNSNITIINEKLKNTNEKKEIVSLLDFKNQIVDINKAISIHNNNFDNLDTNRIQFQKDIWNYLALNNQKDIADFNAKEKKYEYLTNLNESIRISTTKKIEDCKNKIEDWQQQTVTTKEAVDNINQILKHAGFDSFEIIERDKINNISQYYLKREQENNTTNIFKSLSEGEKNFIAFLYFYQLCLGSDIKENSNKKKIIVIDDPVSSLDSQVLFIVTTLVHQLIEKKGKKPLHQELKNNNIEQVFILSHNLYFHKEVSLEYRPICFDKSFFYVSKINNNSNIEIRAKNDIHNDYTLLWNLLKNLKQTNDTSMNITICNIMRRILESYVQFTKIGLGKTEWDSLNTIATEDPRYIICSALISEINDGSHKISPLDDMYFQRIVNETPQNLFMAFEMIFREIAEPHYEAMME